MTGGLKMKKKQYRDHGEEIAELLQEETLKKTCLHWWVRSGTGLRCKICGSRQKAKVGR